MNTTNPELRKQIELKSWLEQKVEACNRELGNGKITLELETYLVVYRQALKAVLAKINDLNKDA